MYSHACRTLKLARETRPSYRSGFIRSVPCRFQRLTRCELCFEGKCVVTRCSVRKFLSDKEIGANIGAERRGPYAIVKFYGTVSISNVSMIYDGREAGVSERLEVRWES